MFIAKNIFPIKNSPFAQIIAKLRKYAGNPPKKPFKIFHGYPILSGFVFGYVKNGVRPGTP